MISFAVEENLHNKLLETIKFLRENSIHPKGNITTSRILRVALVDFIEKQNKIKKVSEETGELNQTAEEVLKQNARL